MEKKLIFVSGKGGTGKTTVALCLARQLALLGRRTLLVELGERSSAQYLASFSNHSSYHPQATTYGFDWALLRGADCLQEYVGSFVKVEKLAKYFFNNPLMKTLLDIAPGLDDLAILGKLTSHVRSHGPGYNYDHIIIDSHSTGSFMSMLMTPQLLSQMVTSGPLHTQSKKINEVLLNSNDVHTIFVGLLEDLPVDELIESIAEFEKTVSRSYSMVMNKKLNLPTKNSSNKLWDEFISKKKEKQREQFYRLTEKHENIFEQSLITESLNQYLLDLKKGDSSFLLKKL